jgi:uncharacterized phage protein (TIGR01671 family)
MIPKFRAWHKKYGMMKVYGIITKDTSTGKEGVYTSNHTWIIEKLILMQSTGLKDKNGKEIFEGDIIKYELEWGINNKSYKYMTIKSICDIHKWKTDDIEVIGNIHETPSLLRGVPDSKNQSNPELLEASK